MFKRLFKNKQKQDSSQSKPVFIALEKETHLHDMQVGPCKCGAWHSKDDWNKE